MLVEQLQSTINEQLHLLSLFLFFDSVEECQTLNEVVKESLTCVVHVILVRFQLMPHLAVPNGHLVRLKSKLVGKIVSFHQPSHASLEVAFVEAFQHAHVAVKHRLQ